MRGSGQNDVLLRALFRVMRVVALVGERAEWQAGIPLALGGAPPLPFPPEVVLGDLVAERLDLGSTSVIQRRFEEGVPPARVPGRTRALRTRSER